MSNQNTFNKRINMNDKKTVSLPIPAIGGATPPVDITEAKPTVCIGCKGIFFNKVFRMGKISQFAPGNTLKKDITIEYPTYLCRDCGTEVGQEAEVKQ